MKIFTPRDNRTSLDKAIDKGFVSLDELEIGTDEFQAALDDVKQLHGILPEMEKKTPFDWGPLINVAGNLAVAIIIVGYEKGHVITTKVVSLLIRGRI